MDRHKLSKLIKLHPQRWVDFYAGAKTTCPTEIPPMFLLKEIFAEHLLQKVESMEENGIVHFKK